MLNFLSYEPWRYSIIELWRTAVEAGAEGDCPVCSGAGGSEHDCDCEHCDMSDEDCTACQGTGLISSLDVDRSSFQRLFNEAAYLEALATDLRAVYIYTGNICMATAERSGLRPYSKLSAESRGRYALRFSGNWHQDFPEVGTQLTARLVPPELGRCAA